MTRHQTICANILAAQCVDLGLTQIDQFEDGTVAASLGQVRYRFAWDVTHQSAVLLQRVEQGVVVVYELAA